MLSRGGFLVLLPVLEILDRCVRSGCRHGLRLRWQSRRFLKRRVILLLMAFTARVELAKAESAVLSMPSSATGEASPMEFSGNLKMEGTQYFTNLPENPQLNQTQSLIGNFHLQKNQGLRGALDFVAGSNLTVGSSHFGVTEAYFGNSTVYQAPEQSTHSVGFAVGRKLEYWNLLDGDWQLGQWQATYTQLDALKPIDQGLTGVFWKMSNGDHEVLLFGTPIFIPSMGPEVKEKDGAIQSDSRWYRQPSQNFVFRGVVTQVVYSLDVPDIGKLVGSPGGGARYRWGGSHGLWAAASYGYKPINALLLRYRTILRTEEKSRGEVTVSPVVGYHSIAGGDLGYKFDSAMVAVSVLKDQPQAKSPTDDWIQQQPEPFQAVGVHAETDLDVRSFSEPVGLSMNYLRVTGGRLHDVDAQGADMGALFESRFIFTNAASARIETRSQILKKKLVSSLKYLRDFDQKGSLLQGELSLFPAKSWAVSMGFDVLGVDSGQNEQSANFLNQYRANDRYYGGLSYVF